MSSNAGPDYSAPYAVISATDRGGALLIVDVVGLVIVVFSVVTRMYLAGRETNRLFGLAMHKDDLMCYVAMVRDQRLLDHSTDHLALLHRRVCTDMGWRAIREWQR
jgi:hypothetical protein